MNNIIALKASGRDCTNNNELLHKIGVLQCYAMQLFVFTRKVYNRFYGAVSITVVLKETDNKVEGSSPSKTFFIVLFLFYFIFFIFLFIFFFCFRKYAGNLFMIYVFAEKSMFDVLCTCKATSLSKMAKLVCGYSDDARAIIESVYNFCMEEKKSGRKLSLNRVWNRTAALTGVSRSIAQKIVEEKKKAQDEQQQPKQPPSPTSKV